jgi:hypothetical protein
MPIVQANSINTTALVVPDLYVQIVPPQNLVLNGVPTNVVGVAGSAQWGPVNQPIVIGDMAGYARTFGAIQARKYDMGTAVAIMTQQGASNFRCVRVTDGTDAAATSTGVSTCITFTALYTGTLGNSISVVISAGSKASSWRATVSVPGFFPEVFDNITGTGNAFWVALAAAINSGTGVQRGASAFITATAGAGSTSVTAATMPAFTGGTDGVATPATVATNLIGVDTVPRTGMYALRGQGCSIGVLADLDASSTWTVQTAFGLAEGLYMICTGPSGDTIANATTTKSTAGLDSYGAKLMHGDWVWWTDTVNGTIRLVSPQHFAAGRLANLSPEQSSLNKPLYGVVGTQKSGLIPSQVTTYSAAELAALLQAGIDVIANPQPGGAFWGVRGGHNSSSNAATNGDNYTRMTNYIAATLSAGMGKYVGQVVNQSLFRRIRATQLQFLAGMLQQGLLGSTDGSLPYNVTCDITNNPDSRTSIGYVQSDAQIKYQAINEKFIVNVEGGQTVIVSRQTLPSGQA